jgi:hypothetical protein
MPNFKPRADAAFISENINGKARTTKIHQPTKDRNQVESELTIEPNSRAADYCAGPSDCQS